MDKPVTIPAERMLKQYLASLQQAGVTHIPRGESWELPENVTSTSSSSEPISSTGQPATAMNAESTAQPTPSTEPAQQVENRTVPNMKPCTLSRTKRIARLEEIATQVAQCQRCQELADTRTQTVFGVGNPEAKIMFVGEAPGADEDKQGEPFVGRAGKLLDKIIEAAGLTREEIYICNILRCRPPQNRNPSPAEAANCREYLDAQIAIVDPDYIVCWGSVAAKSLLDVTTAIGKLRQKFFKYGRAKVACTYHPSYLLRNPPAKKDVWEDMKWLRADMGVKLK